LQLVEGSQVVVINPISEEVFDENKVIEKFGVPPQKLADYLALVGDKTDNIEGVKGVGPKTAIDLLNTFGSVESILARWDEFKKLFPHADKNGLELSYWLVKLKPPEDLNIDIGELKRKEPNLSLLRKKLEGLEMKSIIKDLDKIFAQRSLF